MGSHQVATSDSDPSQWLLLAAPLLAGRVGILGKWPRDLAASCIHSNLSRGKAHWGQKVLGSTHGGRRAKIHASTERCPRNGVCFQKREWWEDFFVARKESSMR